MHLNGWACELDELIKIKKKFGLFLIEDCSQAHGSKYKNQHVGTFGDISIWSFCQDKIISTGGEGGMISTNNKKLWLKCWSSKDHGKNYKNVFSKKQKTIFKWLHDNLGSNYRMTEMQAAIGREQLKTLDHQIKKRNLIANLYLNGLKDYYLKYDILKKPDFINENNHAKKNRCIHAFYRLNFFINKNKINQKKLIQKLKKHKIECGVGSCPEIYREKIFKRLRFFPKKRLLNAKVLGETSFVIPINPYRSAININSEINSIKKILNNFL